MSRLCLPRTVTSTSCNSPTSIFPYHIWRHLEPFVLSALSLLIPARRTCLTLQVSRCGVPDAFTWLVCSHSLARPPRSARRTSGWLASARTRPSAPAGVCRTSIERDRADVDGGRSYSWGAGRRGESLQSAFTALCVLRTSIPTRAPEEASFLAPAFTPIMSSCSGPVPRTAHLNAS